MIQDVVLIRSTLIFDFQVIFNLTEHSQKGYKNIQSNPAYPDHISVSLSKPDFQTHRRHFTIQLKFSHPCQQLRVFEELVKIIFKNRCKLASFSTTSFSYFWTCAPPLLYTHAPGGEIPRFQIILHYYILPVLIKLFHHQGKVNYCRCNTVRNGYF